MDRKRIEEFCDNLKRALIGAHEAGAPIHFEQKEEDGGGTATYYFGRPALLKRLDQALPKLRELGEAYEKWGKDGNK